MFLPNELQEAIALETEKYQVSDLSLARENLTKRYQNPEQTNASFVTSDLERCAYIISRMPATYAAISHVLSKIPDNSVKSLLDLGAGPGTAMWAAMEVFPELETMTLIERDASFMAFGKRLAAKNGLLQKASWLLREMLNLESVPNHDVVILSYSVGELSQDAIERLVNACWSLTDKYLVIIEPGTPVGFERIRKIRSRLLDLKGYMVAPCPHADACPMSGGDWCHFSERVERSSFHRKIKQGSLNYEDEKFSYVIVSKHPVSLPEGRIIRHTLKRSGHVILPLCAKEGLKSETVSRSQEGYKRAKKADWGDSWN